jgi:hypothetical protein
MHDAATPTVAASTPPVEATPNPVQPPTHHSMQSPSAPDPIIGSLASDRQDPRLSAIGLIRKVCSRFHNVARQLRQRGQERATLEVEDENDVQDLLHVLLSVELDDIQTEAWTPVYAGGTLRNDLLLKQEGIVIVVKKTRQGMGPKVLFDQMSVDVQRYMNHPDCRTLICFIYDPEGRIGNPKAVETGFARAENGRHVEVLISPK